MGDLNFSSIVSTSTPFIINLLRGKFLINQNEQYYSVKDNQLTELGIPIDDVQKGG